MERYARRVLVALVLCLLALPAIGRNVGTVAAGTQPAHTHACVFDHLMLWSPSGACRPRARHYPKKVSGGVERAIYDSALVYGIPYRTLLQTAGCESSLNPRAVNGPHLGLFQFLPPTFRHGSSSMRRETGITAHSLWNPLDASYVAGYLFAIGKAGSWVCTHWQGTPP
jgi:Transglycosylase SLT domain